MRACPYTAAVTPDADSPATPSLPAPWPAGWQLRRVAVIGGELAAWHFPGDGGRALLLLHDAGLDSRSWLPYASRLAGTRPLWLLDFPGHGATRPLRDRPVDVEEYAIRVAEACRELGEPRVEVMAVGLGSTVAAELAHRYPATVAQLTVIDVPLRDYELRGDIGQPAQESPAMTAERARREAWLSSRMLALPQSAPFLRAAFDYDLPRTLGALKLRVRYFTREGSSFADDTHRAARLTGSLASALPARMEDWPLELPGAA